MQAETKQKMNAAQVLCEKCGEFCNFDDEKCPACGAPLFDNENESKEPKPLILMLPEPPDLHYSEPSQLTEKNQSIQIGILVVFLLIIMIVLSIIVM